MAGLFYYAPGRVSVYREDLAAIGLGYAFERNPDCRQCQRGPDGDRGVVFADSRFVPLALLGYFEAAQRWSKVPGSAAWVGVNNDTPPKPNDLARDSQIVGHYVALADDQSYLCPVARALDMSGDSLTPYLALPRTVAVDESGEWGTGGVVPKFRRLWDTATRWFEAVRGAGIGDDSAAKFEFADIAESALLALQTNYRVGKAEVSLLGLFDDRCMTEVLQALVDWPTLEAWLKKKAASSAALAGSSSEPGVLAA